MNQLWCIAGLVFLMIFILYGVSWIRHSEDSIKSHPDENVNPVEQINNIGIVAMEEMDRISEKFLNEAFEYINQGDHRNG